MARRPLPVILLVLLLVISALSWQPPPAAAAALTVDYTLTVTGPNRADVLIRVSGAPAAVTDLDRSGMTGLARAMGPVTVTDEAGRALPYAWTGSESWTLRVQNGASPTFVVRYAYDALQSIGSLYQEVVFEPRTLLFIASRVFLMPAEEPVRITARVGGLPESTRVFASLPEEGGDFVAVRDLFGDLRYDFGKAYFAGGVPLFTLDHRTEWGDTYRYIWFDRDTIDSMWLPSYGTTPWEEAKAYMALTERLDRYLRERVMAPLPSRTVLFTNARESQDRRSVMSNTDFYHYMQIWPRNSEGDLAHHLFHAWSFHFPEQSKLSLDRSEGVKEFLKEGLPTYLELAVPATLSGEQRHLGKLFELWALEQRGRPHGIQENVDFHVKYNQAAMRTYLVDRYLQRVTGGQKDVTAFTRALWDAVKDRRAPEMPSEALVLDAFARVAGEASRGYLQQVNAQTEFPQAEFAPLLPAFRSYVKWLADTWFAGNELLVLGYLDIVAAKGGNWPHFATVPHNIPSYKQWGMTPFWEYLQGRPGAWSEADVLAALKAATGRDHPGFFEFWAELGFPLQPASLRAVRDWDPSHRGEGDLVPTGWESRGSLSTEHNLTGIPQQATVLLDAPAPSGEILLQVTLENRQGTRPLAMASQAVSGEQIRLDRSFAFEYRGVPYLTALFRVTITDEQRRRFPLTLTLPDGAAYPRFQLLNAADERELGSLYYLPPIAPTAVPPVAEPGLGRLTMPAISLAGARYVVRDGSRVLRAAPGETVAVRGPAITVDVVDEFGFLRGRRSFTVEEAPLPAPISVRLGGQTLTFDVDPVLEGGRVLVPLRAIAEAMGARVDWDAAAQAIRLTRGGRVIGLAIGGREALVDGETVTLDVPPQIRDGRTLVPVRFIAQGFGATVGWDGESRTVTITTEP